MKVTVIKQKVKIDLHSGEPIYGHVFLEVTGQSSKQNATVEERAHRLQDLVNDERLFIPVVIESKDVRPEFITDRVIILSKSAIKIVEEL